MPLLAKSSNPSTSVLKGERYLHNCTTDVKWEIINKVWLTQQEPPTFPSTFSGVGYCMIVFWVSLLRHMSLVTV